MFSFDKLVLFVVSMVCLGCVMYIGLKTGQATANETMILGGLIALLGDAKSYLFSALKSETKAQSQPPAAPVVAPVVPAAISAPAPAVTAPEVVAPPAAS